MNDTDKRGSNLVDGTGRGALSFGERETLKTQRANRATDGMTPGEVEAANLKSISTDSGGLKRPVHTVWERTITVR